MFINVMDDQTFQSLIRAASPCELPSADAVERFIDEFHRRQCRIAMQPSLFEKIHEEFSDFFSHFHVPALAYVSATAIAVFLSVLILRSPRLNQHQGVNPLVSEELEAPLNYVSTPALQDRIEPVTFELKKKNYDNDSVETPLSYILKRKHSPSCLQHF